MLTLLGLTSKDTPEINPQIVTTIPTSFPLVTATLAKELQLNFNSIVGVGDEVYVTVKDSEGNIISNLPVEVSPGGYRKVTDEYGVVTFNILKPGKYTLITGGEGSPYNFAIKPFTVYNRPTKSKLSTTTIKIVPKITSSTKQTSTTITIKEKECQSSKDCPKRTTEYYCDGGDVRKISEFYECINYECNKIIEKAIFRECRDGYECIEDKTNCQKITTTIQTTSTTVTSTTLSSTTTTTTDPIELYVSEPNPVNPQVGQPFRIYVSTRTGQPPTGLLTYLNPGGIRATINSSGIVSFILTAPGTYILAIGGLNTGYKETLKTITIAEQNPTTIQSTTTTLKTCIKGYLDEYKCSSVYTTRKYQNSDCSYEWVLWEHCGKYYCKIEGDTGICDYTNRNPVFNDVGFCSYSKLEDFERDGLFTSRSISYEYATTLSKRAKMGEPLLIQGSIQSSYGETRNNLTKGICSVESAPVTIRNNLLQFSETVLTDHYGRWKSEGFIPTALGTYYIEMSHWGGNTQPTYHNSSIILYVYD